MSTFEIGERDFLLDGHPHRVVSGALHYFRVHPDAWADRIHKAMESAWEVTKRTPLREASFRSVPLTLEARTSKGFSKGELTARLKTDAKPFGRCLAALHREDGGGDRASGEAERLECCDLALGR